MNIKEDLEKTNAFLDKFEENVGLNKLINAQTIELAKDLSCIDWAEHKNKSAYELLVDSCILTDYANSLQRIVNKEKANLMWCKERIKRHCGTEIPKQQAYSYEERETLALNKSEIGKALHYKRTESELYLARLENLYFSYKNLADRLDRLAEVKLKEEELKLKKNQVHSDS